MISSIHCPGCEEKIIPPHMIFTRYFHILKRSNPREISWFSVHLAQVTQFVVFGFLLIIDPFALNVNEVLLCFLSRFSQLRCPRRSGMMFGVMFVNGRCRLQIFSCAIRNPVEMLRSSGLDW